MAIKETKKFLGIIREINLSPQQVLQLQNDILAQKYHPDILDGRLNDDGSATIKGHFMNKDLLFILDADVEGQIFS